MKEALTKKEKLFCTLVANGTDPRRAAATAGYKMPLTSSVCLLSQAKIRSETEKLIKREQFTQQQIMAGYRRLAFGGVADAVKLMLFADSVEPQEIEKLDLFNVAEIKMPKSGGIEIKFADRLKALEKLQKSAEGSDDGGASLLRAIAEGAAGMAESVKDE